MDTHHVVGVANQEELEDLLARVEKDHESWRVMVFPLVFLDHVVEFGFVYLTIAHVEDIIVILVFFVEKFGHLGNTIAIDLLEGSLGGI